ncbi:MAG: hypothetical protein QM765_31850 [Myxococcales bacterium]
MTRVVSLLLALAMTTGCASLQTTTHTVRVVTEPEGANVAVLEHDGRKDLGASPAEYKRDLETYRCGNIAWLIPVMTTLVGGGAGFGAGYAWTERNDKLNSGINTMALFAAVGLAAGIAVAAECRMKDGEVPEHKDVKLVFEAAKEGYLPVSAPLSIPAKTEELKLVLPPLGAATPATESK